MKQGCLLAFLAWCGLFAVGMAIGFIIEILPGVSANFEGIGSIIGYLFFFLVGPWAFIHSFRNQKKTEKAREAARPENLRPTNLSGLRDTLSKIEKPNEEN